MQLESIVLRFLRASIRRVNSIKMEIISDLQRFYAN